MPVKGAQEPLNLCARGKEGATAEPLAVWVDLTHLTIDFSESPRFVSSFPLDSGCLATDQAISKIYTNAVKKAWLWPYLENRTHLT